MSNSDILNCFIRAVSPRSDCQAAGLQRCYRDYEASVRVFGLLFLRRRLPSLFLDSYEDQYCGCSKEHQRCSTSRFEKTLYIIDVNLAQHKPCVPHIHTNISIYLFVTSLLCTNKQEFLQEILKIFYI